MKANILVEYGPVEIGGKTYLCPVKSVSISQAQPLLHALQMQDFRTANMTQDTQNLPGSLQTLLNDVAFEQYHVFTCIRACADGTRRRTWQECVCFESGHT